MKLANCTGKLCDSTSFIKQYPGNMGDDGELSDLIPNRVIAIKYVQPVRDSVSLPTRSSKAIAALVTGLGNKMTRRQPWVSMLHF